FEDVLRDYDVVLNSQDGKTLEKSLRILKRGGAGVDVQQRYGMPVVAGSASGHDDERHSQESTGLAVHGQPATTSVAYRGSLTTRRIAEVHLAPRRPSGVLARAGWLER